MREMTGQEIHIFKKGMETFIEERGEKHITSRAFKLILRVLKHKDYDKIEIEKARSQLREGYNILFYVSLQDIRQEFYNVTGQTDKGVRIFFDEIRWNRAKESFNLKDFVKEGIKNNDGRSTCVFCGAPTRKLDIGFGHADMRVCTVCNK